jgi:choice-of-anchor A domain-containing protein/uncharacterized repeat protein (TIGR01451 family)
MKKCWGIVAFALALGIVALPVQTFASVLGTAGEFNTFIFGDYSCTSDAEGRVAVGGNMAASGYSVADKLTEDEVEKYNSDMLIVAGNLTFASGRVYYGNIRVGGNVNMPSYVPDGELITDESLPIDFDKEKAYLEALSEELSRLSSTGTVVNNYGGLSFSGDGESTLQVFTVDGSELLNAWGFQLQNVPSGATVLFNVSGSSSGLTNMSLEALTSIQDKVLFNFYEATSLQLSGVAVRGSVLAPFAQIKNPQGVIWGTIIAASWNGLMQQNHVPFTGEGFPESSSTTPEDDGENSDSEDVVVDLNDNKDSQYKITFVEHDGNTWTYKVEEINGRSLSHWDLGIGSCLSHITDSTPSGAELGIDGSTGFTGIKWNVNDGFTSGLFTFTLDGDYPEDIVTVLAKAGRKYATADITGPNCTVEPVEEPEEPDNTPWESDLSVAKTAPAQAEVGDTITYVITVNNNGPSDSEVYEGQGVQLTDTLPEGITLLSVTPSQGTCDETISCDLGALDYLQSATVEVNVKVEQAGTIVNTATVSSEQPGDPDLSNNTSSVETVVSEPQVSTPGDVLLIGINDDEDRFEIYNTETKEKTFPKPFDIVISDSGKRARVEATDVPDEIESLVYVGDGTYYGIQSYNKAQNVDKTSQLYKFTLNHDTTEITIEKVGEPFSGTDIDAIEYGDGVFYAMDNKTDTLLVLDMDGNIISSTKLKKLGLTKVEGLAYKDGVLYASDTQVKGKDGYNLNDNGDHSSSLFTIDVVDGLDDLRSDDIRYIGQIGFGQVEALTFVDDILYGTSDLSDSLFSIDLGTGFATFMDDWGSDIEGIAAVFGGAEAVPEPGTMALVGLGLLGIGLTVRRKRRR